MKSLTIKSDIVTHQLARLLYWCSLVLLLAGMWVLIDPFGRKAGGTLHVYITLAAFELYIWLLLVLGRWQSGRGLIADTARSGVFAVVLTGVLLIALNELYMVSAREAYGISMLAVLLASAKLLTARRWLELQLPGPLLASSLLWIIVLTIPAPIIHSMLDNKASQHAAGYLICWLAALLMAGHLPLVAWQRQRGFYGNNMPLHQWWIGWLVPGMLSALAVAQLYATMWGLFVDWAQWYFSPILLAGAVVGVSLSHTCGRRRLEVWLVMLLFVFHAVVVWADPIPKEFPSAWRQGLVAYAVHPLYTCGTFISVLLAFSGLLVQRWWLFAMAWVMPVTAGAFKGSQALWHWRPGKGLVLLIGAFLLLAAGALLQWWQEHWGTLRLWPKPSMKTETDNNKGFNSEDESVPSALE